MTVVPRGVLTRRRYAAVAIALAIALWALVGLPSRAVRAELSPIPFASLTHTTWPALRRWIDAVADARLFPCVRGRPPAWSRRSYGARIAATIRAFAPPPTRTSLRDEVFAGAPFAARAR